MKVLVIGNGFDLAHNLRTTYKDFLEYVKQFNLFYKVNHNNSESPMRSGSFMNYITELFKKKNQHTSSIIKEFHEMTVNNIWIEHFRYVMDNRGEDWVDFEKEISSIVMWLEETFESSKQNINIFYEKINSLISDDRGKEKIIFANDLLAKNNLRHGKLLEKLEQEIIEEYLHQLDELTRAFEIYLMTYINETVEFNLQEDIVKLNLNRNDAIISFNYTDTYNKLYKHNQVAAENMHFIHGKADIKNKIDTNNMVFGIDDFHDEKAADVKVKYVSFIKYFQRIIKGTDASYKDLFKENDDNQEIEVYVYGHSLDITDKDILKEIFENERTKITIFYHDLKAQQKQVNNLVKVLGRQGTIKSAYDSKPKISFKKQIM